MLAAIAGLLKDDYAGETTSGPWAGSPFSWILKRSSEQRRRIGKQLVVAWCAAKGLKVTPSGDPEADRVIAGRRVTIRSSTLWKTGIYRFRRIRDEDYQYAICLGISPFDAHCWLIPKELLKKRVMAATRQRRRRESSGFSLSVRPAQPQEWLRACGGTLSQALAPLRRPSTT